jgi:hypothetical protein
MNVTEGELPFPITLDDMIAEIETELQFRADVFPRRMQTAGLALQNQMRRRVDVMKAIKAHLEAERDRR